MAFLEIKKSINIQIKGIKGFNKPFLFILMHTATASYEKKWYSVKFIRIVKTSIVSEL